ncbi:MAG: hypothetical protein ABJK25_13350 [Halieaceae bacterium]
MQTDIKYIDSRKVRNGKYRIRVRNVAEDQIETVELAFQEVMEEIGTQYANVGLEALCLHYLACRDLFPVDTMQLSEAKLKVN